MNCVFNLYTPKIRKSRYDAVLTKLPDNYDHGWIIWDYRHIDIYGVNKLIEWKKKSKI